MTWPPEIHGDVEDAVTALQSGDVTISGTKTFSGDVKVGTFAVGNATLGVARQPNQSNVIIDGSTLSSAGASGVDKVGQGNSVTFRGGFSGETGFGASNPSYIWGANDFVTSGTTAGDLAGIGDFWGRLSEVHLATPSASVIDMFGLAGQANIDSTATSATVTGWMASVYANGPVNNGGGTVANMASLYTLSPAAGAATNVWNIYAGGDAQNFYGGQCIYNAGMVVNGTTGSVVFRSFTPNVQGTAAGVYLGSGSGTSPAVELSDGTNNVRLDTSSGTFRILKAGVASLFQLDLSGNATITGGLSFSPATTTTAPAAGGAGALPATPTGYMTITVGGTARKVAYY